MNTLGVDYGRKKVGIAFADGKLAEPYTMIRYIHTNDLYKKLERIVNELGVQKIVIGISEGKMAVESSNFADVLRKQLGIEVQMHDETLSSKDAQNFAIEAGIKRKKRKHMEDAYAAAIMLQGYLDSV